MPHVAVLPGDGIGPEVAGAAQRVLAAAMPDVAFTIAPVGAAAIESHGMPLPLSTRALCERADAILFGAVGGPGFDGLAPSERPEASILELRRYFGLFANVRPSKVYPGLEERSPVRASIVRGMDVAIVRELTGGLYFGTKTLRSEDGITTAREMLTYTEPEIERIVRFAFELALTRRNHLTSVDKNNVLVSSQLWRSVVERMAPEFPSVTVEHMLVDNAAMQLVRDPCRFDVIVTENMFGDILSDEAATVAGSIGTAASASLSARGDGAHRFGLYEPISGTAPDIAGRDIANPTGAILSAAMLARFSLAAHDAAPRIEEAVEQVLREGPWTADLAPSPEEAVGTTAFTDAVIDCLHKHAMVHATAFR